MLKIWLDVMGADPGLAWDGIGETGKPRWWNRLLCPTAYVLCTLSQNTYLKCLHRPHVGQDKQVRHARGTESTTETCGRAA